MNAAAPHAPHLRGRRPTRRPRDAAAGPAPVTKTSPAPSTGPSGGPSTGPSSEPSAGSGPRPASPRPAARARSSEVGDALTPSARALGLSEAEVATIEELAHDYLSCGASDVAVRLYRGLTALEPGGARGWLGLGVALDAAGALDEVELALQRAHQLDPADPRPPMKLAEVLLGRGELERARTLLARAQTLPLRLPGLAEKLEALLELTAPRLHPHRARR